MRYFVFCLLLPVALFSSAHILCYHGFDDSRAKYRHTVVSAKTFVNQLLTLKAEGKKFVPLSYVVAAVKESRKIDQDVVVITVDDAYKSFYETAFPILRDAKIPFALLVYVEAVDKKFGDYMNWDQVREVSKYGEVALHSYAHKDVTKMSKEKLIEDTATAFKRFEKELGARPKYYAYPFGFYNLESKNIIKAFGFDSILTVDGGEVNEYSDVYSLERVAAGEETNMSSATKLKALDMTLEKPSFDGGFVVVKGKVKNYAGKSVKLYSSKKEVKTLGLAPDGSFEARLELKKVGQRQRLAFVGEGNRHRIKLIEKD